MLTLIGFEVLLGEHASVSQPAGQLRLIFPIRRKRELQTRPVLGYTIRVARYGLR
jgi:hypothetical protein